MPERRSKWLWGATVALWLLSPFLGPCLLSLPWTAIRMPYAFVDQSLAPILIPLYAVAFCWLVILVLVGLRHSGRMRWIYFGVPLVLAAVSLWLGMIGANSGFEVSLAP